MESNLALINSEEVIFSLDIGTRTVIGVVSIYVEGKLKVVDSEILEHDKRNMYDGQIHDINGVVEIVKKVKENLEKRLNYKLTTVAIAAAGRALKTYRTRIDREIDTTREIDKRLVESLEMEGVQKSQDILDKSRNIEEVKYYCIGYTVVNYYLDNNYIENLEGHKGNKIGVDVLATFLPHVVVDSLYTVMNRVGLEVVNITLEPIAAINVAIKKSLRLLNLALIDIGAGTSDIAITKDGTIVAYAMASIAGDEITEQIAKKYLLDFETAETIKINLTKSPTHRFHDIVGIEHELTTEEILNDIKEAIELLAKEIAEKILEYNEKAPSAIFVIGGGSQIPRITEYIANILEMPKERVVIRDSSIVEEVIDIPMELRGPHAITPLGIATMASRNKYKDFLEVMVNGQQVKLFNSKDMKVSDALILMGFNPRKLIPKRGDDFIYYLNGIKKSIKGSIGKPAEIYVNNKFQNLEYQLKSGDVLTISEATMGEKSKPNLFEIVDYSKKVFVNNKPIELIKTLKVNGSIVSQNIIINENDHIEVVEITNISELLSSLNKNIDNCKVLKNGNQVGLSDLLEDRDYVSIETINVNKRKDEPASKSIELFINGELHNIKYDKNKFEFVDIFNHIDFDLTKPKGILVLKINGEKAEYLQELISGDKIDIYWQK